MVIKKHKRFNNVLPYTYYIRRKSDGVQYHGVRINNVKQNRTPEEDFAYYYFSSGKFKYEFKTFPYNFYWKLCWTFDSLQDALDYETKINEKIYKRQKWINSFGKYIPVESSKISREKTLMANYGVNHNFKISTVQENRKTTFIKKYGVVNPSQSSIIKQKKKSTMNRRYGVNCTFDMIDSRQCMVRKYGVSSPLKLEIFRKKQQQTNLNKYGVPYTFQSEKIIQKLHQHRKEMYIRLAKMTNDEFLKYLGTISSNLSVQNQKIAQRIKGMEILKTIYIK